MTATATAIPFLLVGDDVTIRHPRYTGQVWTVHRIKRTKAIIKPKDCPEDRGLDADLNLLVKTGTRSDLAVEPSLNPSSPGLAEGVVVRLTRPFRTYSTTDLLVITKVNTTTFSLDRLGGNRAGETGLRSPRNGVTKVDLSTILR